MKQQKFRRYKGSVFYRKKRKWPSVLATVASLAVLTVAGYFIAHYLHTLSSEPSSVPSDPSSATTTTTNVTTTTASQSTTTTTTTTETITPQRGTGEQIAALAATLIDKPFVSGGAGPDVFDNYGLVYYCLKTYNIPEATRYVTKLFERGTAVEHGQWQPGDVVFFSNEKGTIPNYMGIYIGNGKFVAANNPDKNSCTYNINGSYFSQRYLGARRFTD